MATTDDFSMATTQGRQADSLLLWILVWSELAVFGALLVAFMVLTMMDMEGAALFRAHLHPGLAAANTIILVLSGWQAALAVRLGTEGRPVRRPLVLAALLGLAFVAVKIFEYTLEARAGIGSLGALAELYFLVTGFHLLHVVFGAAVLLLVAGRPSQTNVVTIATLWHAVDLVWLVMFPIVYLT
ncbi:cytochrome c oxidase subunit 3 [Shinella zoogloeoides]|uniref:Cytochrome c oxidase subunit 3 family protein n=1 Tax=Shinella zoogloeoides TaxID=352475 RepID=A0A6N8TJD4_SHIZO|nr:cytochrome c oxidase subunit 3 [Shinella zoogloeoides]MXO03049.1 cytochrome c oxidase subunit 3 family protein [Shinella zoogloeoides]UEX83805.1 cytochrome c oxidase subunit 3 [Shinella zoogloeoides]